jgi:hypothetical protein
MRIVFVWKGFSDARCLKDGGGGSDLFCWMFGVDGGGNRLKWFFIASC